MESGTGIKVQKVPQMIAPRPSARGEKGGRKGRQEAKDEEQQPLSVQVCEGEESVRDPSPPISF